MVTLVTRSPQTSWMPDHGLVLHHFHCQHMVIRTTLLIFTKLQLQTKYKTPIFTTLILWVWFWFGLVWFGLVWFCRAIHYSQWTTWCTPTQGNSVTRHRSTVGCSFYQRATSRERSEAPGASCSDALQLLLLIMYVLLSGLQILRMILLLLLYMYLLLILYLLLLYFCSANFHMKTGFSLIMYCQSTMH